MGKGRRGVKQGAELGDPLSARWAAYILEDELNKKQEAYRFYDRAYKLGDGAAAHSMGALLMDEARRAEAGMGEEKARRRAVFTRTGFNAATKKLSAFSWRETFASLARQATGDDAARLNRSATQLYRVAFELGYVDAAQQAGDLLREIGDLRPRDAHTCWAHGSGMRVPRSKLGKLELGCCKVPGGAWMKSRRYWSALPRSIRAPPPTPMWNTCSGTSVTTTSSSPR